MLKLKPKYSLFNQNESLYMTAAILLNMTGHSVISTTEAESIESALIKNINEFMSNDTTCDYKRALEEVRNTFSIVIKTERVKSGKLKIVEITEQEHNTLNNNKLYVYDSDYNTHKKVGVMSDSGIHKLRLLGVTEDDIDFLSKE